MLGIYSVRRVSTSLLSGMGGRVRCHLRQLHTATCRSTGTAAPSNVFALALGSVMLGLGGYYVGVRRAIEIPPLKPVYGTREDFAHAIEELKTLFSEDTVVTAKDQLESHGFSPIVYHPGTRTVALRLADVWTFIGQGSRIALSSFQTRLKMS
jgi:hypothetical protein